jgi:GNAT superfamily N-acetyltransferase
MVEQQGGRLVLAVMRTLTRDDVGSAIELSSAANWNQTAEDWQRIIYLAPESCRCIEEAGKIVATTTLLPYGQQLAWIGMVLTHPEYRRKGLARRLIEDAITAAERIGICTLKLDATSEGRPLYESLGFVAEQVVERWGTDAGYAPAGISTDTRAEAKKDCFAQAELGEELIAMDSAAFGASRLRLLELLMKSGECRARLNGYALSRAGRSARYLGPCVVNSEAEASKLISAHLQSAPDRCQPWYWDLLSKNRSSIRCAKELGFTRRRTLWRMRRGQAIENNDAMVYAIAGFELG